MDATHGTERQEISRAVEALLASPSWQERLAAARESRRLIIAERRAPLVLRAEWLIA